MSFRKVAGPFTERIQKMVKLTASLKIPWLQAIPQIHLDSEEALLRKLCEIVKKRVEGLMLHRAYSMYQSGRSDDLLKLKPWQDEESTVIEILPGKGKYNSMMGVLLLKDKSGHILLIGTSFS